VRTREDRVAAVDDERGAELLRERRGADAADRKLAVFDGGRVREQV
jgi:hypothetical protein